MPPTTPPTIGPKKDTEDIVLVIMKDTHQTEGHPVRFNDLIKILNVNNVEPLYHLLLRL